uniref:Uncharacterized protein n=1 Tax=Glossina brevipalpis TaxID=37001 RepID=A0A1A9X2I3_9MUSC
MITTTCKRELNDKLKVLCRLLCLCIVTDIVIITMTTTNRLIKKFFRNVFQVVWVTIESTFIAYLIKTICGDHGKSFNYVSQKSLKENLCLSVIILEKQKAYVGIILALIVIPPYLIHLKVPGRTIDRGRNNLNHNFCLKIY